MYIKVRIIAEAKKEIVYKISESAYKIHVREKAERNMANKRLLEILREIYPHADIRIINGHHSPIKLISIDSR